jgi:hypothetical protein
MISTHPSNFGFKSYLSGSPLGFPRLDASEIMTGNRNLGNAFWCPDIQLLGPTGRIHSCEKENHHL